MPGSVRARWSVAVVSVVACGAVLAAPIQVAADTGTSVGCAMVNAGGSSTYTAAFAKSEVLVFANTGISSLSLIGASGSPTVPVFSSPGTPSTVRTAVPSDGDYTVTTTGSGTLTCYPVSTADVAASIGFNGTTYDSSTGPNVLELRVGDGISGSGAGTNAGPGVAVAGSGAGSGQLPPYTCGPGGGGAGGGLVVLPGESWGGTIVPGGCTVTTAGSYTFTYTVGSDVPDPDLTDNAVSLTFVVSDRYTFGGFRAPVDSQPTVNTVKAGASVPVKFSLGGDMGLHVFAAGHPAVQPSTACGSAANLDIVEQTSTASANAFTYDPATDTYTFVWKTAKTKGCYQLVLRFDDGQEFAADFLLR